MFVYFIGLLVIIFLIIAIPIYKRIGQQVEKIEDKVKKELKE